MDTDTDTGAGTGNTPKTLWQVLQLRTPRLTLWLTLGLTMRLTLRLTQVLRLWRAWKITLGTLKVRVQGADTEAHTEATRAAYTETDGSASNDGDAVTGTADGKKLWVTN